jgi:hypothetical protein
MILDLYKSLRSDIRLLQLPFKDYVFDRNEVSEKNSRKFPKGSALYCLIKQQTKYNIDLGIDVELQTPVYIGQSTNVFGRLKAHRSKFDWDTVCIMKVKPTERLSLERFFIRRHKPSENKRISQITLNDLRTANHLI